MIIKTFIVTIKHFYLDNEINFEYKGNTNLC